MSNEFEKNDDLLSATPADRLKQLSSKFPVIKTHRRGSWSC